jgi:proton-translocating NAD(P)+ transhydrogenase subunit alpha
MIIGILKEQPGENRIAMLPDAAAALVKMKAEVFVEKGAGEKAFASDSDYEKAGAKVVSGHDIVKGSDIILSVNPPDRNFIS